MLHWIQKRKRKIVMILAVWLFWIPGSDGLVAAEKEGTTVQITFVGSEDINTNLKKAGSEYTKSVYQVGDVSGIIRDKEALAISINPTVSGSDVQRIEFSLDGISESANDVGPITLFPNNIGDFSYTFDVVSGNDVAYRITDMHVIDVSGNELEIETDNVMYVLDNQAPVVAFSHNEDEAIATISDVKGSEGQTWYFISDPSYVGTVEIYDLSLVKESVLVENAISAKDDIEESIKAEEETGYKKAQISRLSEVLDGNGIGTKCVYRYKFDGDGKYHITVNADDLFYHGSEIHYEQGNLVRTDGTKWDSGVMVVDSVPPQIIYNVFDKNGKEIMLQEGQYYNQDLRISATATDEYMDPDGLKVTVKGVTSQGKLIDEEIRSAGDVKPCETSNCDYTFSQGGEYVLQITASDMAGNLVESGIQENIRFFIDQTAPKISIHYDNMESQNGFYFQESRVAQVTITDFSFDESNVEFMISSQEGNTPTYGEWKHHGANGCDGTIHRDECAYTIDILFDEDDVYDVGVLCRDKAGNIAQTESREHFVIDREAPVIDISYDYTREDGAYYYNATRTANISITDLSFDERMVEISPVEQTSNSFHVTNDWSSHGKYNSLPVIFENDGKYMFSVVATDLAGNRAEVRNSEMFVIDKTAPTVEFSRILNYSANNGEVRPEIIYRDTYLDDSRTNVVLSGTRQNSKKPTYEKFIQQNEHRILYQNFDYAEENDDLYVLTASVWDLAGNVTESTITFSVNRFGSVYVPSEETRQMLDNYYIDGEEDIVVTEINVDYLTTTEITCSLDGEINTLKEGKDYSVIAEGVEGTWKTYRYRIDQSNFERDGHYVLTLYSLDKAENHSDNRIKNTELSFAVDKTKPSLVVSGIESNAVYAKSYIRLTVDVQDNMRMDALRVYVDNKMLYEYSQETLQKSGGIVSFDVNEATTPLQIKVVAKDCAGNEQAKIYSNVVVSTKQNNSSKEKQLLMILGGIIVTLLIGTGICVAVLLSKVKKQK